MKPRLLTSRWLATPALLCGLSLAATAAPGGPPTAAHPPRLVGVRAAGPISGRVVDAKGAALPGVTVLLLGTTTGASTNSDGTFVLDVPATATGATLRFSFVGFVAQDVAVGSRTEFNVTLLEDTQKLSEVVVIAYGEQSTKTVSSSVSKIDGETISRQAVGTPGESLASLAPGVEVQSDRGGTPGAPPSIRIRGGSSLGTPSDPLFVVDGYPLQDAAQFNLINPSDIESVSILKDAASTAIYGSRAANGIVIVTTKRGKAGQTTFGVSAYTGVQQVTKRLDVLNRDEYIQNLQYQARARAYNNTTNVQGTPAALPGILSPNAAALGLDPTTLPDTDWQDVIFRNALISNYQVSATGGSEKTRFAISGGYFKQDGVLRGSKYDRFNVRFNLDANLSSKLKIGVSVAPSYAVQDKQAAAGQFNGSNGSENGGTRGVPNAIQAALLLSPTVPVRTANGDYGQPFNDLRNATGTGFFFNGNIFNPLAVLELNQNRTSSYRMFGNTFLEWEPLAGLRLRTTGGGTLNLDNQSAYIPATLASEAATTANLSTPNIPSVFARESQRQAVDYLWENTASYTKQLGDHNFSVIGLFSLQKFTASALATAGKSGTVSTDLLENPLASPDRVGELGYDANAFVSYGGRLTYDFRKKYLFTASIRQDGSSRFGPNNKFAVFPAASVGWRISEEGFFAGLKPTVSEFKVRASYGLTGNANIGSFSYLNTIQNSNYSSGGTRTFGYRQNGFPNYDLTWEKNRQLDLGGDLAFLGDKLTLSLDYYRRYTTDMLFVRQLPGYIGYATNYQTNYGELLNKGLELAVGTNQQLGEVRFNITGNISGNRTEVTNLGGLAALPTGDGVFGWPNVYQVKVGDPLGNMYGFEVLGVFNSVAEVAQVKADGNRTYTGDLVGNWIIKDQNGDGLINELDRVKVGKGVPDFIYGLNTTVQYKGLDLGLTVQGVQGINVIQGNSRQFWNNNINNTTHDFYQNMWDPADPDKETRYPRAGASGITPSGQLTDRQVYNGSYLRIRNLTLGYALPKAWMQRVKMQTVRVYVTGQNLVTFTKYPGYNPETNLDAGTLVRPGLDQGTYPAARTYTVGLNFGF